jgi:hypothetical protein
VGQEADTPVAVSQAAADPPQLWLVQVVDPKGAIKRSVFVCADAAVRETLLRARAEVNGKRCKDETPNYVKENGWALRCVAGRQPFAVSSTTIGDLRQDFQFDFTLTPIDFLTPQLEHKSGAVRQVRHFRRIGLCPSGWRIGDHAKPGRRPHRT